MSLTSTLESFLIFFVIGLLTCESSIFKQSKFKGLPQMPEVNVSAGERRDVFYHEQNVIVIDVDNNNETIRCEVIEAYDPEQLDELFRNLSSYTIDKVELEEMLAHMKTCDELDNDPEYDSNHSLVGLVSIFWWSWSSSGSGILPGTKWCGKGNIGKSYHDLGDFRNLDRCCRAHDLCPVKIRGFKSRYNISNENSFISKSHCLCDETFYNCLKSVNNTNANMIGQNYFNFLEPMCIEDEEDTSNETIRKLVPTKMAY